MPTYHVKTVLPINIELEYDVNTRNRKAHITRDHAGVIRLLYAQGTYTQQQLATMFNTTRLRVWEVLHHVCLTETPNHKYGYSRTGK
jgi:predicted ATP-dependent Lon-type protease